MDIHEDREGEINAADRRHSRSKWRKVRAARSLGRQLTAGAREREDSATEIYRHARHGKGAKVR